MIRTDIAKKHGGTTVIPLTGFRMIEPGKAYIIEDAILGGEKVIIIREDKGTERELLEKESN